MVQKSVACGIELLVAISAATDLAVNMVEQHNLSLIDFCSLGKANIYSGERAVGFSKFYLLKVQPKAFFILTALFIPLFFGVYPLRVLQKPNVG